MHVLLLGPVDANVNGRSLPLGGVKTRAALAMLALEANRTVTADHLIEGLWGECPPASAAKMVQNHVWRLRSALGADGGAEILTRGRGYELRIDPDRVDVRRFEGLLVAASRVADDGGPVDCARRALTLWRGPALADVADEPFAAAEIRRLEELRVDAAVLAIAADVAAGRDHEIIAEVERLIAAHPLRERLHALRMLALYRSGRQADALEAYLDARRLLVDAIGVEPGRQLQSLHRAILAQDTALDLEISPREPGRTILEQDPSLDLASPAGRARHATPASTGTFVGREREFHTLLAGLDDAIAGRGRLWLISGEPGIGKTRLADEVVRQAEARGVRSLTGRCWEAGGAPAYWPWAQALRGYVRGATPDALRAQLGMGAVELAKMLPELREALPALPEPAPLDSEGARFRLLDATAEFLRSVSAAQPTVLVIDDVHAADPASLAMLRFLARELGSMHLLVLAAYRDVDPVPGQPLTEMLVETTREAPTHRLSLGGLTNAQVLEYLHKMAPGIASPQLATAVHEQTEGNPLFLGETVRLLAVEGVRPDAARGRPLAIPPSIRDVIARRLTHLPDDCNRALVLASVLGREFPLDALARLEGVAVDALLDLLDEAISARVVSDVPGTPGRLRFAHVLIRDTLYNGLPAARRAQLHCRVARTLEDLYGQSLDRHRATPERIIALAHHWSEAGDPARAISYYRRGAEAALRVFANYDAMDALTRAIDLLRGRPESRSRDAEELELTMMLAVARGWGSTHYSRARDLCVKLGRPISPPILRGMVLDALLRLDLTTARDLAIALLAAAERDGDEVILVEAEYAMGVTSFWAGRFREARHHLQQAIDRYTPERHATHVTLYSQDPKVVCLSRLAWTLWFLGQRDEAADARDAAVSLGDTLGHPLSRCYAYFYGAIVSHELGDEASRARLVATSETIATDAHLDVLRGWAAILAHAGNALRGDRGALANMGTAISGFEERGQMLLMAYFRSLLGSAHLVAGEPRRGLEAVAKALIDTERTGFRYLESELHRLRGELLAASGADAASIDTALDLADDIASRQEAVALERRAADARRQWRWSTASS